MPWKKITASVVEVNIKPNDTNFISDKIRGTAIGSLVLFVFSELQLKNIADGIVMIQ